jgi:hypothetical protein
MWGMEKKKQKKKERENMQRMGKKKLVGKAIIFYSTRFRVLTSFDTRAMPRVIFFLHKKY